MFGSKTKTSGSGGGGQAPPAEDINNEENLIKLHSALIEFYHKHKPENLDNDVLIILMQFYIDNGSERFNQKLRNKYGEDLATFTRGEPARKPKANVERKIRERENRAKKNNRNVQSTKVTSVKKVQDPGAGAGGSKLRDDKHVKGRNKGKMRRSDSQFHRTLPPMPKDPNDRDSLRDSLRVSKRRSDKEIGAKPISKPIKNRVRTDSEYTNMKKTQPKNKKKINEYVDSALEPSDLDSFYAPDLDDGIIDLPEYKLGILDNPKPLLKPRDLIEAFYSKHDETKLDTYGLIEKFVDYAEQNNVKDLSRKLEKKYGQGLEDSAIQKLAIRRKNLEGILTEFYLQHDPSKIKTRWAVLKIVTWSMKRGLPRLNGKFQNRYGLPVVHI
uniref:Uncharacterized protein n=1 Tax=Aplanochytrium stocchinoi TaxID=215587 RepID=A0A7S3LIA8_9STRA|mmetsp:Transcript_3884/g.4542  ORF Transcript_3884/g.4542 Transcript_3884/m.4542 type:complete len:385 (+) Transcript_3884:6-1160(+)